LSGKYGQGGVAWIGEYQAESELGDMESEIRNTEILFALSAP